MSGLLGRKHEVRDPNTVRWLTTSPGAAWFWLPLRLWLGWQWFRAGGLKVSDEAWIGTGSAIRGFWQSAVAIPEAGQPPTAFDWYRAFLRMLLDANAHTWFARAIAWGEVLVGVALIVGAFTGVAAFCGAVMNFNFMLAGSASTNPMLLIAAIGLILAWKVSGYVGLDRWLLPLLGTPWGWAGPAQPSPVRAASPQPQTCR